VDIRRTGLLTIGFLFGSGCTVQHPPVAQTPPVPVVAPQVEAWQAVPAPLPAPELSQSVAVREPAIPSSRARTEKMQTLPEQTTGPMATYVFQPNLIYRLSCSEWGMLMVKLLPGEVFKRAVGGNPVEWMIDDTESGGSPVIIIRRGPFAPTTEMAFITDVNIYRFVLSPGGSQKTAAIRQITFYDPEAEIRRAQAQEAHARAEEERHQRAQNSRIPSLSYAHMRTYQVQGDRVAWWPVRVVGDQQHTIVELPAGTDTALPTLSVMQDGVETRINYRTVPGHNGTGPVMVTDQALRDAQLVGTEGIVRISVGGQ